MNKNSLSNIKNLELTNKSSRLIPGLTQLLSKRPDQFAPELWPTYFDTAVGSQVTDVDGNVFLDMSISGIGANVLGYQDAEVDKAVVECIGRGNSSSLNAPEEVELAELLCELHPWASKVRYARTGGEAMAIAARIARACTGKDLILFCGYHGWSDWYLAANLDTSDALNGHLLPGLSPLGVPKGLKGTSIPFKYNDLDELQVLLKKYKNKIAAVVMEPVRNYLPQPGYLESVKQIVHSAGAILIFDEVSAGFRITTGGSHLVFGVNPDIAVFAKAISNGYPMAAIIGTDNCMSATQETFISSTYWTDRIGPTAAIATIKKHKRNNVHEHLNKLGELVQKAWTEAAIKADLDIEVTGIFPMSYFSFKGENAQMKMTIYIQQMLQRNILASNRFYANFAQTEADVEKMRGAIFEVFSLISTTNKNQSLSKLLMGPISRPGFKRMN